MFPQPHNLKLTAGTCQLAHDMSSGSFKSKPSDRDVKKPVDATSFVVQSTDLPECEREQRAKALAPALRILCAMFSRLLLDRPAGLQSDDDVIDRGECVVYSGIITIFEYLYTNGLMQCMAGDDHPDLKGLFMQGDVHDFLFDDQSAQEVNEHIKTQLNNYLLGYLNVRGLNDKQPMVKGYYMHFKILKEYFSGYSHSYMLDSRFSQLLTICPKLQQSHTTSHVLVVCTGKLKGDMTMQGIVTCPFFSARFKGLGKLVVEHMHEVTRTKGINLRVDPHTDACEWKEYLAKQSFVLNLHGKRHRPQGGCRS